MARVTAPHGRIVISAWLPEGAVSHMVRMARETPMAALDAPSMPPAFAWHDHDALSRLLEPHGFSVDIEPHAHVVTAASIDYLREDFIDHPLSVASRAMLEARGKSDVQDRIVERAGQILTAANEKPDGFAVTCPTWWRPRTGREPVSPPSLPLLRFVWHEQRYGKRHPQGDCSPEVPCA